MRGLLATEDNLAVVDFGRTTEAELTKKQLGAQLRQHGFPGSVRSIEGWMKEGMPSRLDSNRRMFVASECRQWLAAHYKEVRHA